MIYLSDKEGITSTSANYLANLAKEIIKKEEATLRNIQFYNTSVELINGEKKALRIGWGDVTNVESALNRIADAHAFCAWIREAIKAKDNMLSEITCLSIENFCKLKGIELPVAPEKPKTVDEQDIINEMNIKERNNYLKLEAFASTFGKYIHPDGYISNAREELIEKLNLPHEVSGDGRDMVIYSYDPSIGINLVEDMFINLQSQYREYEKQLNAIKYSIKEEVSKRNVLNTQNFKSKYNEYSQKYNSIVQDMSIYIQNGRNEIASMKIVIPEKLKNIYDYLESLGK